ncbi:MAG: GIY-YIG nuclease family protein, partial [Candidatus Omnitrophota bacterium]
MYYVYVLENDSGWHYIGSCGNIEERLKRHNQNSVRSTKHKGP